MLGLLLSHASMVVHAATHATQDAADCWICMSHGNLSEALADEPTCEATPASPVFSATTGTVALPQSEPLAVRQRGPPALT